MLDTNVVLDLLLAREPFATLAEKIFIKIESKEICGYLCPTSIATIYYLMSKHLDKNKRNETIRVLLDLFEIVSIDKTTLEESLKNCGSDFEDSIIYTSAKFGEIDCIITRDRSGFKKSTIKVLSPSEFLNE